MNSSSEELRETQLRDRIENDFTYHTPSEEAIENMREIRGIAKHLAHIIRVNVPHGRERSTALTRLEEAVMHVNAGISRQFPTEK